MAGSRSDDLISYHHGRPQFLHRRRVPRMIIRSQDATVSYPASSLPPLAIQIINRLGRRKSLLYRNDQDTVGVQAICMS